MTKPSRIVTKVEAGCVAEAVAPNRTSIKPRYILTRHDGWTLGCRARDLQAALKLWGAEWEAVSDLRTGEVVQAERMAA